MSSRKQLIFWWSCAVLWAAFIFFMSAHTGNDLDSGTGFLGWVKQSLTLAAEALFGPGTDAVSMAAHFLEYMVFGGLLACALMHTRSYVQAWRNGNPSPSTSFTQRQLWFTIFIAIAIASLYGVTDEFHQSFVPGRMSDPLDWVTDTLGALLGASLYAWLLLHRRSRA